MRISFFIILSIFLAQIVNAQTVQPDTFFVISNISIVGNKITKERIITRELTFKKGDTISSIDFENRRKRSEENLMNTSLFNSVHISSLKLADSTVEVYILLT